MQFIFFQNFELQRPLLVVYYYHKLLIKLKYLGFSDCNIDFSKKKLLLQLRANFTLIIQIRNSSFSLMADIQGVR